MRSVGCSSHPKRRTSDLKPCIWWWVLFHSLKALQQTRNPNKYYMILKDTLHKSWPNPMIINRKPIAQSPTLIIKPPNPRPQILNQASVPRSPKKLQTIRPSRIRSACTCFTAQQPLLRRAWARKPWALRFFDSAVKALRVEALGMLLFELGAS